MPTAFIVRPFGKQKTRISETPVTIDFDEVEKKLIDPALDRLGITGRTTGEIVEAGNIRDDMFELLLTRDLVIADVTIQNANVFYELGIRHALRDKRTFMIRGKGDPMPFDNLTDRYFQYDLQDPGASVERLADAIKQTIDSEAKDSPVFRSVPNLKAPESIRLSRSLQGSARRSRSPGRQQAGDLLLWRVETRGFDWEIAGASVGGASRSSISTPCRPLATPGRRWKQIPDDQEANEWLGTIYQRMAER